MDFYSKQKICVESPDFGNILLWEDKVLLLADGDGLIYGYGTHMP